MAEDLPSGNLLVAVCLGYVAFLFAIAFWAERRAERGELGWLHSPFVYTLSLSVYCTAWTFYGAVGSAARGGLEFVAIYLGPTLVFVGWYFLLRKLVTIGQRQRITSIADLISSRYGKSASLGVAVTLLAVVGSTPYIALQLKSLTLSFEVFAPDGAGAGRGALTALWVAAGLAAFTILFGTRNIDANERHHGVVTAIAAEALVKLAALLSVGVFVVWGLFDGPAAVFAEMPTHLASAEDIVTPRWVTLVVLSATAVICLPRMFQVAVVEHTDPRQLATASWAFPLYLALISIFVLPIAIAGLATPAAGSDPDLFVLTLPLSAGQNGVALLAFLGGFSAATSMVIVATIALSTMVSNHIVIPLWLHHANGRERDGDLRRVLVLSWRISIVAILGLGYLYFLVSAPRALAAIGLMSFAGMAQVAPALIGALYWRGATRNGALAGMAAGFVIWAYTLFLPSFEGALLMSPATIAEGPFGINALRPQALFGQEGVDPLVHAMFWSWMVNIGLFVGISLAGKPQPLEQVQALQFVDVYRHAGSGERLVAPGAAAQDLLSMATRILGAGPAQAHFAAEARAQGKAGALPDPTERFIAGLERRLAGSVGATSAHELVRQITGSETVSLDSLMRIADETVQLVDAKRRLEKQSSELEVAAASLRDANDRLRRMDAAKDAFLSQVSHELRTPMTSIRSFAEILADMPDANTDTARRFLGIIHEESERLTRLLDEILDLSFLESGHVTFNIEPVALGDVVERALASSEGLLARTPVEIVRDYGPETPVVPADFDRLAQVVINLITNAVKYGNTDAPKVVISVGSVDGHAYVQVRDNGPGIPDGRHEQVFEKFLRLEAGAKTGSAGLGLPISREIMRNLGGDLKSLPGAGGATFRAELPLA